MELPESFYEEEVRCGYTVSAKMKKVWAIELLMLEKFIDVCERNGLNYYLDGGTLLGAVRHKGFIPWDDDIDVIMPREDYDRLWEIAEKEFTHPYFFQTTLSEDGFFRTHAQLRYSNSTGFIAHDGKKPGINKGIFLDIFVLDSIPDGILRKKLFKREIQMKKDFMRYQYDREYEKLSKKQKLVYKFVHAFFKVYPFKKAFVGFNKMLGRYRHKKTRLVGDVTLQWRTNVHWPREWWYEGYTYLSFEGLKARVPLFYRNVLAQQYGDYMKIPDDVTAMNGRCHGAVTFEPDIPYQKYFASM